MSAAKPICSPAMRTDWSRAEVAALFRLPFSDLMYRAQTAHRLHFDPNTVQISTLLSVKTGGCPEDCAYCPQSVRFATEVDNEQLLSVEAVVDAAKNARANGATRFCMGAAYRRPKAGQLGEIKKMVTAVHELGLETCATLGMLEPEQAEELKDAGLDYYNHNLDTSENFYPEVITTRTYQDRRDTLQAVRDAGLKVCCGGIIGMGEGEDDWIDMLHTLATLPEHPGSVPINQLVQVAGTPLADAGLNARPDGGPLHVDALDFVRVIAVARILMPASHVRLSAGRTDMSDEMQALCFVAGANSIFYGDKLLTTPNPEANRDLELLDRLGMRPEQ
ncbi:MAG: biotin synthase BioB [Gammaproteobacteria bacterium]